MRTQNNQILRYLDLIERRLEISIYGDNWPENTNEMAAIDKELAELKPLVEQELAEECQHRNK